MIQYVLYKESIGKFIGYSDTKKVLHVSTLKDAHKFDSPKNARSARQKASKKMAYYYVYAVMENGRLEKVSAHVSKRKLFSRKERMQIYRKTKGYCYLCGEFLDFDNFEIEHKIPLTKGGTNDFKNLFPACHYCNTMKNSIYSQELIKKVTQIFMYQMEIKNRKSLKWKIIHRLLKTMI